MSDIKVTPISDKKPVNGHLYLQPLLVVEEDGKNRSIPFGNPISLTDFAREITNNTIDSIEKMMNRAYQEGVKDGKDNSN